MMGRPHVGHAQCSLAEVAGAEEGRAPSDNLLENIFSGSMVALSPSREMFMGGCPSLSVFSELNERPVIVAPDPEEEACLDKGALLRSVAVLELKLSSAGESTPDAWSSHMSKSASVAEDSGDECRPRPSSPPELLELKVEMLAVSRLVFVLAAVLVEPLTDLSNNGLSRSSISTLRRFFEPIFTFTLPPWAWTCLSCSSADTSLRAIVSSERMMLSFAQSLGPT